jgi:hypothetical protein
MSAPRRESELLLYAAPDGAVKVGVLFQDETAWLTQKALAELFGVGVPAIAKHLKNIFEVGELAEKSVVSILETTAADRKSYHTRHYNLDAIIAVGYRVNSYQATQFRIWATKTLREFMIKGFVLDDERLKQGKAAFGKDYFSNASARSAQARGVSTRRSPTFTRSRLTTTRMLRLLTSSSPRCRTSCIGRSPGRPPPS